MPAAALGFCFAAEWSVLAWVPENKTMLPLAAKPSTSGNRLASQEHGLSPGPAALGRRTDSPAACVHSGAWPGPPRPRGAVQGGQGQSQHTSDTQRGTCMPKPWCSFLFLIFSKRGLWGRIQATHVQADPDVAAPSGSTVAGRRHQPAPRLPSSKACELSWAPSQRKTAPQISRGRAGVDVWLPC